MPEKDRWARWLGERRFGGDPAKRERMLSDLLHPIRDRVLDGAEPLAGQRVLDVGCGEGMIGFEALERGASLVVFSDVSGDLLHACEARARDAGVESRCCFLQASAEDLSEVESGSVDVVTTRSVLIYVRAKGRCFREFRRVLSPSGRLSVFEPINRFGQREWTGSRYFGVDMTPVADLLEKIRPVYGVSAQTDPMLDFDERDLIRWAEEAGFVSIALTLTAEVRPAEPQAWATFANTAGNPNLPTLAEAMAQALTEDERVRLTGFLRPLIESGLATRRMAHAYVVATSG